MSDVQAIVVQVLGVQSVRVVQTVNAVSVSPGASGGTGSTGSVTDAPIDDATYGRKNAAWIQVNEAATPIDGGTFN